MVWGLTDKTAWKRVLLGLTPAFAHLVQKDVSIGGERCDSVTEAPKFEEKYDWSASVVMFQFVPCVSRAQMPYDASMTASIVVRTNVNFESGTAIYNI